MEAVERSELVECATEFFRTGIRCQWFEKMLLEALVCAEWYATIKQAKTTPSAWTGRAGLTLHMLCGWAYQKSRGEDPKYAMLMLAGRAVLSLVKLGVLVALAWGAVAAWRRDNTWLNLTWLFAIGAPVAGIAGRWFVQLIVGWSRPQTQDATVTFLQGSRFGRALTSLAEVYQVITASSMSTSLARQTVLKSYELGGGLDQIIVAYLDRALAAHEYEWSRR
jgi:hypothetical protein